MEQLTIKFEMDNGVLVARCLELNLSANGEDMSFCLENLQEKISDRFVEIADNEPSKINGFIKTLHGGEREWKEWLDNKRYQLFRQKLENAFLEAYPKAEKYKPFLPIPFIFWDDSDNYEAETAKQRTGYEGLIRNGKEDKDWIHFVRWIVPINVSATVEHQRKEWYQKMKDLGLPVQSFAEIMRNQKAN